jgi:integrase
MRIFRPQATKPIPPDATIDHSKGIVSYRVKGKTRKAVLTDGGRMRIESTTWHIEFSDHLGRRQHVTAYRHEAQSRLLAAQIDRLVSLHGQTLPPDMVKPIASLPSRIKDALTGMGLLEGRQTVVGRNLEELLTEFEQSLKAQELNARYVGDCVDLPRLMFKECGFEHFKDINANRVEVYLKDLREGRIVQTNKRGRPKKTRKLSYRRSNMYLKAAKLFCSWLIKRGYAYESPLNPLKMLDCRLDRRHVRRALDTDELKQFLYATATGPERFGMTGAERFLLYRFACETGLRADEIRKLRKVDFDFGAKTVRVKAETAKGRREDTQHLSPGLAGELRDFMAAKLPDAKAFGGWYTALTDKTVLIIQKDLAAAGIPYKDESGRVFDFHSLRGQCATLLALSGVSMKTAQTILRHKDVNLTANVYTHVLRGQEAQAVAALPDLSMASLEAQVSVKTGTDDTDVTPKSLRKVYAKDESDTTKPGFIGQSTLNNASKTAFSEQDQGPAKPPELKVAGSSPAGDVPSWRFLPTPCASCLGRLVTGAGPPSDEYLLKCVVGIRILPAVVVGIC